MLAAFALSASLALAAPAAFGPAHLSAACPAPQSGVAQPNAMDTEADFLADIDFRIAVIRAIASHPEIPGDLAIPHFEAISLDCARAMQTEEFLGLDDAARETRMYGYKDLTAVAQDGTWVATYGSNAELRSALRATHAARRVLGY